MAGSERWYSTLCRLLTFGSLCEAFRGRHTLFVVWFALSAFVLALLGKLTAPYVAMCSALQAAVLGHSIKEDLCRQDGDGDASAKL